jgi:hypothetical protein
MARATALTVQQLTGPYPTALVLDDLTFAASDGGANDGDQFTFTGNEIIIAYNSGATPRLVTLESVADPQGRVGNVTKTVAAGAWAIFQASEQTGWLQSNGMFYLNAAHLELQFAIVRLK